VRYRIDLEYDGAAFAGWQLQPADRTVQGVVEAAIERAFGHPARVEAAGRTDSGVSAAQQVVVFDTDKVRRPEQVRDGLNVHLPDDVGCLQAWVVADDFSPRHAPHCKTYRYTWLVRPTRPVLRRGACWHERRSLDVASMHEAVQAVVGTHDFTSFRAAGCSATHPVRTLEAARVTQAGDEVRLEVEGTGFLQHMVRIMAGTLHDVGRGRMSPGEFASALEARDRSAAGRTAPAHGLLLVRVVYR